MNRALLWVGCCLLFVAAWDIATPRAAMAVPPPSSSDPTKYVAPAPASLKHPKKLTLAGSAFTCAQITRTDGGSNPGQCLRVSATVDSAYDTGVYLPDGGIDVLDGTYNTTADGNQLPAATPETLCLQPTEDGICIYSASAGTGYVAQRKP